MSSRKVTKMDQGDIPEPGQPEPRRKSDQEIFDEQIARASGKFIIQLGGLGILAALVISVIALIVASAPEQHDGHRLGRSDSWADRRRPGDPAQGRCTRRADFRLGQARRRSGLRLVPHHESRRHQRDDRA